MGDDEYSLDTIDHSVPATMGGSSPLMGDDEYPLDTIDHSVPATMGKDPESVIIKVPKSKCTSRHHFHLGVKSPQSCHWSIDIATFVQSAQASL